jgi:hypothetical protein
MGIKKLAPKVRRERPPGSRYDKDKQRRLRSIQSIRNASRVPPGKRSNQERPYRARLESLQVMRCRGKQVGIPHREICPCGFVFEMPEVVHVPYDDKDFWNTLFCKWENMPQRQKTHMPYRIPYPYLRLASGEWAYNLYGSYTCANPNCELDLMIDPQLNFMVRADHLEEVLDNAAAHNNNDNGTTWERRYGTGRGRKLTFGPVPYNPPRKKLHK